MLNCDDVVNVVWLRRVTYIIFSIIIRQLWAGGTGVCFDETWAGCHFTDMEKYLFNHRLMVAAGWLNDWVLACSSQGPGFKPWSENNLLADFYEHHPSQIYRSCETLNWQSLASVSMLLGKQKIPLMGKM